MSRKSEARISQITIRGMEPELQESLQRLAEQEGLSLNQAALRLMRQGACLPPSRRRRIGNALDRFVGTLSEDEAQELLEAVSVFERVDESFWK